MKGISKRFAAAVAALVVFVASLGLAGTAMAADTYVPSVTVNGTTVTVQTPEPNQEFYIQADDTYVAGFSVTPAADKWFGAYKSGETGKATVKLNPTDFGAKCGATIKLVFATEKNVSTEFAEKNVTLPATGDAAGCPTDAASNTQSNATKVPNTGAAVMPYAIVAALLVSAGVVILVTRKNR